MPLRKILVQASPWGGLSVAARYLIATGVVLLFAGLRWLLQGPLENVPFLLFFPAVVMVAIVIDRGTGIYSSFLSTAIAFYCFVPPRFEFVKPDSRYVLAALLFLGILLMTAWLIENLRETGLRLLKSEREQRFWYEELEHRMRNNLALIGSMLRLQMSREESETARLALDHAIRQLQVVARVQTRLREPAQAHDVDMARFIGELCRDLESTLESAAIEIRTELQPIRFDARRAVYIGLIINELVTNAVKHAFIGRRTGKVTVCFTREDANFVLEVADDGSGGHLRSDRNDADPHMGSSMVQVMSRQLGGRVEVSIDQGMHVRIIAPLEDTKS